MNGRIIATVGIALIFLNSCEIGNNYIQMSHQEFLQTHKFNVGQSTIELIDHKRERPVKTEIWYPTKDTTKQNITTEYPFKLPPTSKDAEIASGKFPLIMLSHGTGGNRISQMWLACELAGNGYIVASVDHYGNTLDNKIPENFVKVWDRPLDVSFAIDRLLTESQWVAAIDTTQIGMAGFSLGGYTTIALAGGTLNYELLKEFSNTKEGKVEFDLPELGDVSKFITPEIIELGNKEYRSLKDYRISAFVAMAPAIGQGFNDKNQFKSVDKTVLIIGGQNDERTPVKTNAKHYNGLINGSKYIELKGQVGHYIFMNEAKKGLKKNAPIVFKDDKSVDRKEIHENISKMIVKFFNNELNKKSH